MTVSHTGFQFVLALLGWDADGQRTLEVAMGMAAAAVCAADLVVISIADLHTAFGGSSAVDYLAIASAGRVVSSA
ncbi:MAG: hypothetical protein WB804_02165 [Candidatus Dormiibacterota bacterium]